ncbi:hypothetical protein ACR3K2_15040 [Cryptosporidium serpentis]
MPKICNFTFWRLHWLFSTFFIINLNVTLGRVIITQLYGDISSYGYYYAKAKVGHPTSQTQSLIVDTGSSLLAFACTSCFQCGRHMQSPFNISNSSTAKWINCEVKHQNNDDFSNNPLLRYCECDKENGKCSYKIQYEEGSSIFGHYFEDFIQFEPPLSESSVPAYNNPNNRLIMGCHHKEESLFLYQAASGIIGLANIPLHKGNPATISMILQSVKNQSIQVEKVVSICLANKRGFLTFGSTYGDIIRGINNVNHTNNKYSIGRCKYDLRYCTYIGNVIVDGISLSNTIPFGNGIKAMLDSGTTASLFPESIYKLLHNAIATKVTRVYPYIKPMERGDGLICWYLQTSAALSHFPVIKLSFAKSGDTFVSGVDKHEYLEIEWYPQSYLYLNKEETKKTYLKDAESNSIYCLGIMKISENTHGWRSLGTFVDYPGNSTSNEYSSVDVIHQSIVLGSTFFIGKDISFYLDEPKVTIERSDCNASYAEVQRLAGYLEGVLYSNKGAPMTIIYPSKELEDDGSGNIQFIRKTFGMTKKTPRDIFLIVSSIILLLIGIVCAAMAYCSFITSLRAIRGDATAALLGSAGEVTIPIPPRASSSNIKIENSNIQYKNQIMKMSQQYASEISNSRSPELLVPVFPISNFKAKDFVLELSIRNSSDSEGNNYSE